MMWGSGVSVRGLFMRPELVIRTSVLLLRTDYRPPEQHPNHNLQVTYSRDSHHSPFDKYVPCIINQAGTLYAMASIKCIVRPQALPRAATQCRRQWPASQTCLLRLKPVASNTPRRAFTTTTARLSANKKDGSKVFATADLAVADIKSGSTVLSAGFGLCGVAGKDHQWGLILTQPQANMPRLRRHNHRSATSERPRGTSLSDSSL